MKNLPNLPFVPLLLLISFASVNAVLFTPALPDIVRFFAISEEQGAYMVSAFLVGYALGQLLYGPLANRYGRKTALYMGITLQIVASLGCVLAGLVQSYLFLIAGRFMAALGCAVGLSMTFTLVNEHYDPERARQKISYLLLAFAITPGLGVALGGLLNTYFGWMSCFMASIVYGIVLLLLIRQLPLIAHKTDPSALYIFNLIKMYANQLKNTHLLVGGLLMGGATCFVYVFATVAPFIAMSEMNMSSDQYGVASLIPSIGLILGSLSSAKLTKKYSMIHSVQWGIAISLLGASAMVAALTLEFSPYLALFIPSAIINFGLSFVLANVSTLTLSHVSDKAHGSAALNFINMGFATIVVWCLGWVELKTNLLPGIYLILCMTMGMLSQKLVKGVDSYKIRC